MKPLAFRQIHLDFHTSEQIAGVADEFDARGFAETLRAAHVNSVTLFARCHHGMIYYRSRRNPERIHPGLGGKDLLRMQIDACRAAGIRTPVYTSVQWDAYSAKTHPEWVSRDAEGRTIGEGCGKVQRPFEAGFYATMCLNTPYRDFLRGHIEEILDTFDPVDGIFLDIVNPVDCACPACTAKMRAKGLDPADRAARLRFSRDTICEWERETTRQIHARAPHATVFYNRGHIGPAVRQSADAFTHFELESLPSGQWGYMHFPCTVRFARTLGREYLAQTGKFHTMWGDFGSYKNPAALEFECFQMLALGVRCLIGDQLEPGGRLTPAVYRLVGGVYEQVEAVEPWCRGARPVTEIGVLTPEEHCGPENGTVPDCVQGAVRMLQECAFQFDVLDSRNDFSPYRLLILPDEITLDGALEEKLRRYLAGGGSCLASGRSGLVPEENRFAPEFGVRPAAQHTDLNGAPVYERRDERNSYAQYLVPGPALANGLEETPYVMYLRGFDVEAEKGTKVLAGLLPSVFDRDYRHFCSHRQSPPAKGPAAPGIVQNGRCVYFSNLVFTQYRGKAPLWCKRLVHNAALRLLGAPLVEHGGPSTLLAALNRQEKEGRWALHLLHYIPERRCEDLDVIEDVIDLHDLHLSVALPAPVRAVRCQPQRCALPFEMRDGRVRFTLPLLHGHQIIELEEERP